MAHTAKPYAKVPTLFDRVQDELSAIEAITRVLGSLPDHETRLRVINWVNERFSQGLQAVSPETTPTTAAPAMPPPPYSVDSGLSIPDDLFEPVETSESADLHGVFDLPAAKPHAHGLDTVFDRAAERPHAVATRPAEHAFELVSPKGTSARTDLAGAKDDEPVRMADRRQLNLLLLADMSTPAALKVSEAPTAGGAVDAPAHEPAPPPRRSHVLVAIKARDSRPPLTKNAAPPAASAAAPPKAKTEPTPAPPANPEAAQDSMEAMLRSLVDDFRQLADDWGNT